MLCDKLECNLNVYGECSDHRNVKIVIGTYLCREHWAKKSENAVKCAAIQMSYINQQSKGGTPHLGEEKLGDQTYILKSDVPLSTADLFKIMSVDRNTNIVTAKVEDSPTIIVTLQGTGKLQIVTPTSKYTSKLEE